MRINNNIMALNAHRQLGMNQAGASKSMEKLSSGFRINRAGDDAAGLAISEKMRGQIRGLKQASRNAQDGISLIQTAEGALNETHAILQRMRELAVQASTDTNTEVDRGEIQKEINQLSIEIDRIAETTQFNTMELLDGSYEGMHFHIGANQGQNLNLKIDDMSATALGVNGAGATLTQGTAATLTQGTATVGTVDEAVALLDGDTVVAIQVGSDWYAPDDVEDNEGTLEAVSGAEALTVTEGYSIGGEGFYTQGTTTVGTVDEAVALLDGDTVVAIQVGSNWYAPDDVEDDGGTVAAVTNADALEDVENAFVLGEATGAGAGAGIDVSSSREAADEAIDIIDAAIVKVSGQRSELGAIQNRLEHTIANLGTSAENLQAAESRIRDLDMAEEIMAFTKNNILQQAATAMLAQANMAPQSVLQLLG